MIAARLSLSWLALGALCNVACHRQPALTTPASDQSAYAAGYPERLREVRERFASDEEKTRKSFETLRTLPASVPAANADELERVVRRADAAGRSQPYVDEALRQEDIGALMSENRSAIRRRVAGSVAFAARENAKQKECLKDLKEECTKEYVDALAGTAATATDRAVERQLEERLRAQNPAHRYLEMHADEFGEARVNALERPIDSLTRASFVANVRLALYRFELDDLLEREKAVQTTLERDRAEVRAALDQEGLSKSYRLALEDQVAKDEAASQAIPAEVAASQEARADLEARAGALQKEYQAFVDSLLAELERRQAEADAEPAPAAKASAPTAPAKPAPPAPEAPPAEPAPAAQPAPAKSAPPKSTP